MFELDNDLVDKMERIRRMQQGAQRSQTKPPPGLRDAVVLAVHDDPAEAAERRRVIDIHVRLLSRFAVIASRGLVPKE